MAGFATIAALDEHSFVYGCFHDVAEAAPAAPAAASGGAVPAKLVHARLDAEAREQHLTAPRCFVGHLLRVWPPRCSLHFSLLLQQRDHPAALVP